MPDYMDDDRQRALALPKDGAYGLAPTEVTRVEVIDHRTGGDVTGRVYSARDCRVELSYQDQGRTLKVFVNDRAASPEETR